jgi:hypothetical protein
MNNLKLILQKPIVKLLLLLFIFCLILFFMVLGQYLKEKDREIKQESLPKSNLPPTVDRLQLRYEYIGALPNLLTKASVYHIKEEQILTKERAQEIGLRLGFKAVMRSVNDILGTTYIFNEGDRSLVIYPDPILLEYYDFSKVSDNRLKEEKLKERAQNFIKPIFSNYGKTLELGNSYIEYKKNDFQGVAINAPTIEEAEFAEISYSLNLNGLPVISKDRQNVPIKILLNLDGSVRKATATLFSEQLKDIGIAELTLPSQAFSAINNGMGTISTLNDPKEGYTDIKASEISESKLRSLELIYIYDEDAKLVSPFYRFSGTAKASEDKLLEIEILITALPETVFKN